MAAGLACAVAVLVSPEGALTTQALWILTAAAQLVAAVACLRAGAAARGREALAWVLLAAGQAVWLVTDLSHAAAGWMAVAVPEVSPFDAGWLAYYIPTLMAVALLYAVMQPEPGWLGAIDALVIAGAAMLAMWAWVVGPIAASGAGSTTGTIVNSLYPALDMVGLCVVGWLTVRRRATPRWTLGLVAFFALAVVAGVLYVESALNGGEVAGGLSAAVYTASSACLAAAATARRRGGAAAAAGTATGWTVPPAWSQLLPPAAVLPAAAILVGGPAAAVQAAALAVLLVVIGRLSWSLLVLARLGQAHEDLLRRDTLTAAHNRRFLVEELDRLVARAHRSGASLAAVALDLDGFKALNDRRGHASGDAFLVRLVSEVRVRLRAGDVLCRLGGDEFVVLLPDTDEQGGLRLARRMLDAVAAARAAAADGIAIDGSLGVAAARGAAVDARALLTRADEAMYAAKWSGGGRVVAWRPGLGRAGSPAVAVAR